MSTQLADPVKVFIAEDNPILLQGLERALTANGYAVQTAIDGRALLEMLDGDLPDILLVDVMMPGMNGFEVFDTVRSDARTCELPVVLITAAADELLPPQAGEVEVLMKPFRLNDLLARIEHHVNGKRGGIEHASAPRAVPMS